MYRKNNIGYVLGAGQPVVPVAEYTLFTSSIGLMLGGAALFYFASRPAKKIRNAVFGAVGGLLVSSLAPKAITVVEEQEQFEQELEEDF